MSGGLFRIIRLPRTVRRFRRVKDIASILARHGFADVASRTGLSKAWRVARKIVSLGHFKEKEAVSTGARLRSVCEELGATFIKFGQVLANRPDLLPREVIVELGRLQDAVPPFPLEQVRETLGRELGRPPEELFRRFDEQPLAAASIAQVHRACLQDGQEVVVKIKRPGLERLVREDLAVMRDIAAYLEEHFEELRYIRPRTIVEEFARTFSMEMDLRAEARNLERFARNFADEPRLKVPRVFKELSTSEILVMEYLEGRKVNQVDNWEELAIKPPEIAEMGTRILLRSVFEHRFYHADPHPGNFLIGPDGTIFLLDFGMVGFVSEGRVEELLSFMVALISFDSQMLVESILESGLAPATLNQAELKRDLEYMLNSWATLELAEMDLELMIRTAIDVIHRHRISLPADLLGVARALSTMEGIARQIYPQFSPLAAVQPYLVSLFVKRALDPSHQSERLVDSAFDLASLLRRLPVDLHETLKRLKAGELTLRYDDLRAVECARLQARSRNRLAGAALALSGVAASFYLDSIPGVPDWLCWSSLGLSFLTALWVVRGIRKSGGM